MKKRFWTRLISAVVTMAMAFSILAVPASAAQASWAVKIDGTDGAGSIYITDLYVEAFTENAQQAEIVKQQLLKMGTQYNRTVPKDMVLGLEIDEGNILWMTLEQIETMAPGIEDSVIEIVGGASTPGTVPGSSGSSSTGTSSGSSSDASGAVAILAVGGAAVAAVTGFYLYTHPAVVQNIKDFFQELSVSIQEKVQSLIPASDAEEAPAV